MRTGGSVVAFVVATLPAPAYAQTPPAAPTPPAPAEDPDRVAFRVGGYVEAFWQWNFNLPGNGVTAWRGFDARHNTFSLSNVVVDATWQYRMLQARIALQAGLTPAIAYAAEPMRASVPGEVGTGPEVWRYVQQAYLGLRIPGAERVLLEAGLFLSPVGPEVFAARENWNWSHSNLFYGPPYYHTGVRATYSPNDRHAASLLVCNGWNSVVDNNAAKSVALQYQYTPTADATIALVYFGASKSRACSPWRCERTSFWSRRPTRGRASSGPPTGCRRRRSPSTCGRSIT